MRRGAERHAERDPEASAGFSADSSNFGYGRGGQTVDTKQNKGLDAWLWQLRDAVDQAEDVLDEMEYYKLEKAVQAEDNKESLPKLTSRPRLEVYPQLLKLRIRNCKELSSLDGLQDLPSLIELHIEGCDKLIKLSLGVTSTSHTDMVLRPPMEKLRDLKIRYCKELSSLDGLQDLPSLKSLTIHGCDKLIELGVTSTSHTDMVLSALHIDRHAYLRLEPLRSLSSVSKLRIFDGTGEFTSLDEQWLLQNRNSLEQLEISRASSLESLPTSMIDLQALRHLTIMNALCCDRFQNYPPQWNL
uniref:Rx N-terminal domain-containing protein n=1 Tax=Ananas comosus var. bracteatus TaxID=296719 RepID=A0A6V7NL92_ANACO|nr:unnamed protein product [Ananas comosus var. bracteatus]